MTELRFNTCAVTFSADIGGAAHHLAFPRLEFDCAFAAAGQSRTAVLAYAPMAKQQGRHYAIRLWSRPDVHGVCQQEFRDFQAALEAGGLLRRDFMIIY